MLTTKQRQFWEEQLVSEYRPFVDDESAIVVAVAEHLEACEALLRESNEEFLVLLDTDDPTVYNDYLEHLKGIQARIATLLATAPPREETGEEPTP